VKVQDLTVAQRYATALFNVAKRQGAQDAVLHDAEDLLKLVGTQTKLRTFIEAPQIPTDVKDQLLEKILKGRLHDLTYHTLILLLKKGRIDYMGAILERYQTLAENDKGVYEARVVSAQSLQQADQGKLQTALEKYTGKRLKITYGVDPSLIGGIKVTYGDVLIDDSVKGKLGKLRQQLEEAVSVSR
jgi:F-type H+-transporting ATPase subunit delta